MISEDGTPRPDAVEKKRKPKKQCAICRTRENLATAGSTLACLACRDFFWRVRKFIGVNEFICRKGTGKWHLSNYRLIVTSYSLHSRVSWKLHMLYIQ